MLTEKDKGYVYDILSYAHELVSIIKDETHFSFSKNRIKRLAVERILEIIGEAANHLSDDFIEQHNDIPWSKIIGLRNKIAHDYGEILTDRIWLIVSSSIPELIKQLENKKLI